MNSSGPGASAPLANADYPAIGVQPDGSVVLVWQENLDLRFVIRAARLAAGGTLHDLGRVSGEAPAGMAPQILTLDPLSVAWCEIDEQASVQRVDEWHEAESRWRPSSLERLVRAFPAQGALQLHAAPEGLAATWQEMQDGNLAQRLGWLPATAIATPTTPSLAVLTPDGQSRRATLGGALPAGLTLAWQVYAAGRQAVQVARGALDGTAARVVTLSPPAQRFAGQPDHATRGDWSGVVWIDPAADGGDGGVYFSEVNWPAAARPLPPATPPGGSPPSSSPGA